MQEDRNLIGVGPGVGWAADMAEEKLAQGNVVLRVKHKHKKEKTIRKMRG